MNEPMNEPMSDITKLSDEELLQAYRKLVAEANRGRESPVRDTLGEVAQGATLGWGDEIAAGGAAAVGYATDPLVRERGIKDAYQGIRENINEQREAYREAYPKTAVAANVAGGLTTGLATAPRVLGATPGIGRMGTAATAEGAVAGAGAAEPGSRLGGAAIGGAFGGLLGFGAPFVGQKIVSPLARKFMENPETASGRLMNQFFDYDQMGPKAIREGQRRMGPDATMTDVGGRGVESLSQGVIGKNPSAYARAERVLLGPRSERALGRIKGAMAKATGVQSRLYDSIEELQKVRSQAAGPLYRQLDQVQPPLTPILKEILDTDVVKRAFRHAKKVANTRREELPPLFKMNDVGQWQKEGVIPDFRAWNRIKRSLDDMIYNGNKYRNAQGKLNEEGRALKELRDDLVSELDGLSTVNGRSIYKRARDAWAGPSAMLEAQDLGEKFLNLKTREVRGFAEKASQSERMGFLQGMVEAMTEKMGRARGEEIGAFKFLESGNVKEKLSYLFPDNPQAIKSILREVDTARSFIEKGRRAVEGSMTEIRRSAKEALEGRGAPGVSEAIDSPTRAATQALMGKISKTLGGVSQKTLDELERLLLTPGNAEEAIRVMSKRGASPEQISNVVRLLQNAAVAVPAASTVTAAEAM